MTSYGTDLIVILPELIVVAAACLVLTLDPVTPRSTERASGLAQSWAVWRSASASRAGKSASRMSRLSAFSDLVVVDGYARFWKLLLYGVTGSDHSDVAPLSENRSDFIWANTMASSSSPCRA